ncbi:MAG: hypothetical protein BRD47_07795 [Bacteroidetes bacterium QS_8_68_28]|nr:MAG: hypothetical protein BRD47_07795 [Bacteroidetes bacterium QS_8_68_28]
MLPASKMHNLPQISESLDLYEEGGLDGLRAFGTPGPEPGQQSIPPGAMQALKARLSDGEQGFGKLQRDPTVA